MISDPYVSPDDVELSPSEAARMRIDRKSDDMVARLLDTKIALGHFSPSFSPQTFLELYRAGESAADALKIGDTFTGAWGAFEASGRVDDTPTKVFRSAFTSGYLSALRTPVITDSHGKLTQIGSIK